MEGRNEKSQKGKYTNIVAVMLPNITPITLHLQIPLFSFNIALLLFIFKCKLMLINTLVFL